MPEQDHYFLDLNKVKYLILLKGYGREGVMGMLEYCPVNKCPKCEKLELKHTDFFIEKNILQAKCACENCGYTDKDFHKIFHLE